LNDIVLSRGTTALVLVDLQNDNVHPEGAFASSGAPAHASA
jgi:ureidoacrylate peracid hydrolase